GQIDIEVNRLRQALIEQFNILAIRWRLSRWDLDIGAEDSPLAGVVFAFLCPVDFPIAYIDGDAHAPFLLIGPRSRIALTRVDKRFNVGTIEVDSHHAHAFAVTPVQFPSCLFELELLRGERASRRNDGRNVPTVEI